MLKQHGGALEIFAEKKVGTAISAIFDCSE